MTSEKLFDQYIGHGAEDVEAADSFRGLPCLPPGTHPFSERIPTRSGYFGPPARARSSPIYPRFFDEQLASAVGAIDCVKGSGN